MNKKPIEIQAEEAEALLDKIVDMKATNKAEFWEHVDYMLALLYKLYPLEMIEMENAAKMNRDLSMNKFHATKNLSSRIMGTFPPRLYGLINKIYGEELPYQSEKEMLVQFFKRYKQFSYAEKI
jgi:hypothetical protein